MKHLFILAQSILYFCCLAGAQNKTYYISPAGSDANSGLSSESAWQTISKINSIDFEEGDKILFEAGKEFQGSLQIQKEDKGSRVHPVLISSYGNGKATLLANHTSCVVINNTEGIEIKNLIIKGDGNGFGSNGIDIYTDQVMAGLDYIDIDSVEVFGFGGRGLLLGASQTDNGFSNVSVRHSSFHDNGFAGIETYGNWPGFSHSNLKIAYCKVYNNLGQPITTQNTGNGIVVSGVDGGTIEFCESFNNGQNNVSTGGGPVGIWVYDTKNVTIQYCESHHNKAGLTKDGGGFDIDGGSQNCIIQYCYSHDNEGPGYALVEYGSPNVFTGNIIRYNISQNDGRKNSYGAVLLYGENSAHEVTNSQIYNNTVYVNNTHMVNGTPSAIEVLSAHVKGVSVRNNIFYVTGGVELLNVSLSLDTSQVHFQMNNYFAPSGNYRFLWDGFTYTSFNSWKAAAGGQEMNGSLSLGMALNPLLIEPGKGETVHPSEGGNLNSLFGYRLEASSPLIDKAMRFTGMGSRDFFGTATPLYSGYDMGASETVATTVLQTQIIDFRGTAHQTYMELSWTALHEDDIVKYEVENSVNSTDFKTSGEVAATRNKTYTFKVYDAKFHYFRIRYRKSDGSSGYSETLQLNPQEDRPPGIHVYNSGPHLRYKSSKMQPVNILIRDLSGRLLQTFRVFLQKGENTISLPGFLNWPAGIYLATIQSDKTETVKFYK